MPVYIRYGNPAYKYNNSNRLYGAGAEDTNLHWVIEVDWDGDGIYSGDNEARYCVNMSVRRGRREYLKISSDGKAVGFQPVEVGTGTIILDNYTRRFDPYYSAGALYGDIQSGRFIRIRVYYNGVSYPVIHGKIRKITNTYGNAPRTRIDFEDGMRYIQKADTFKAIQQNIDIDDAIGQVLDYIEYPTIWSRSLEDSSDVLNYWWANDKASTEIQRLADAELGTFFVAADGKAKFYSRHHTATAVLSLTQSDFLKDIPLPEPEEVVRNVIKVVAHPLTTAAGENLWTMVDKPLVANGASFTVWASYSYNNESVPAINVLTPVSATDYTANTAQDGSGTDKTSGFSVSSFTDFGKTAKIVMLNSSGSDAYITLLKVRGDALYSPNSSTQIEEDTASIADWGRSEFILDSDWQQSSALAEDYALWLVSFLPEPQKFIRVDMEGRPDKQFTPDLFDILDVELAKIGIDQNFKVGGIEHDWLFDTGQGVRTTFYLEPFPDTSGYWVFDSVTGNVQMGVNTTFGL